MGGLVDVGVMVLAGPFITFKEGVIVTSWTPFFTGASVGTLAAAMEIGASDGTDTGADTGLGAKDASDDGCLGSIEGDDTDGVVPIGDAD